MGAGAGQHWYPQGDNAGIFLGGALLGVAVGFLVGNAWLPACPGDQQ